MLVLRLKRLLRILPDDVPPSRSGASQDFSALANFVRFPVTPTAVRWRGRAEGGSGRIGGRSYVVELLARFDDFTPIARVLGTLPIRPNGINLGGELELLPPEVAPLYAGKTNVRGTTRVAPTWWAHPGWKVGALHFVCPLGDGPYLVATFSSESVSYGIPF